MQALLALSEGTAHATALRTLLLEKLGTMAGITINSPDDGLPYILNFSVPGIRSETMLHHLAQHGVYVSSGSACARGHKSHVLEAMKLDNDRIDSAIRVSFGHQNTEEDVLQLANALQTGLDTLTRRRER